MPLIPVSQAQKRHAEESDIENSIEHNYRTYRDSGNAELLKIINEARDCPMEARRRKQRLANRMWDAVEEAEKPAVYVA